MKPILLTKGEETKSCEITCNYSQLIIGLFTSIIEIKNISIISTSRSIEAYYKEHGKPAYKYIALFKGLPITSDLSIENMSILVNFSLEKYIRVPIDGLRIKLLSLINKEECSLSCIKIQIEDKNPVKNPQSNITLSENAQIPGVFLIIIFRNQKFKLNVTV